MRAKKHQTYKGAGVDIKKAGFFIKNIAPLMRATTKREVLSGAGSFSGLFAIDKKRYKEPVLVSSTDGVGTKLLLAQSLNIHKWIGFDLVGMCANDVATTGAEPLFFLDYISTGRIKLSVLKEVVAGIASACRDSGYALIGGETAEMPGMYRPGEYDLAGFCTGIIDKRDIIDGSSIRQGDILIGIESSGPHSNGYSLIRKVLSKAEIAKFKHKILKPTRLYTRPLLSLRKKVAVKGIAHVTGGAYFEKIPRIIPKGLCALIETKSWPVPDIFEYIRSKGGIRPAEMYRTFNMGIGMVAVLAGKDVRPAQSLLSGHKLKTHVIGRITKAGRKVSLV